jgi:hypothetical protein
VKAIAEELSQAITMTLNPTPALLDSLYWITLVAVIVSSASGVLKAGFKQFDLFGVIIIAIATGLGGGSLRDMLLDREVFWIRDQVYFIASLGSAIAMFLAARMLVIPGRLFLVADAGGYFSRCIMWRAASCVSKPAICNSVLGWSIVFYRFSVYPHGCHCSCCCRRAGYFHGTAVGYLF